MGSLRLFEYGKNSQKKTVSDEKTIPSTGELLQVAVQVARDGE